MNLIKICGHCGGDAIPIGTLGNRTHYRCRSCHAPSSRERRRATRSDAARVALAIPYGGTHPSRAPKTSALLQQLNLGLQP